MLECLGVVQDLCAPNAIVNACRPVLGSCSMHINGDNYERDLRQTHVYRFVRARCARSPYGASEDFFCPATRRLLDTPRCRTSRSDYELFFASIYADTYLEIILSISTNDGSNAICTVPLWATWCSQLDTTLVASQYKIDWCVGSWHLWSTPMLVDSSFAFGNREARGNHLSYCGSDTKCCWDLRSSRFAQML